MIVFVRKSCICQYWIGVRKLRYLLHKQAGVSLHLGRDRLFQTLRARGRGINH
ncbi:hypothetical protein [Chromohalobacter israelensis]|uniref:hypothetical protein n=1 Tax=Chromohalobacter israelensis TaxID=141390 RepID=UPI0012EB7B7D|nr:MULTISPECIES: hypothetical protein [Chromohalobacter]MBZ5877308.1 hypothetical protein [Chromohalobacter salexigens]MDF9435982.1 hypothetical protein [Chromohalobacter israelensis]